MNEVIKETFKVAEDSLQGFIGVSLVEVETGLSYGSHCISSKFDLEAASAYNSEIVKSKIHAKNAMGLKDEELELIIFELSNQTHFIKLINSEKFLIYMAVDSSSNNMGISRAIMKKISSKIKDEVESL